MNAPGRRIADLEDRYRNIRPDGSDADVDAALDWAMSASDRQVWADLIRFYEKRLGTHPESLSPDDLEPVDYETLTTIVARAYARLGWPVARRIA